MPSTLWACFLLQEPSFHCNLACSNVFKIYRMYRRMYGHNEQKTLDWQKYQLAIRALEERKYTTQWTSHFVFEYGVNNIQCFLLCFTLHNLNFIGPNANVPLLFEWGFMLSILRFWRFPRRFRLFGFDCVFLRQGRWSERLRDHATFGSRRSSAADGWFVVRNDHIFPFARRWRRIARSLDWIETTASTRWRTCHDVWVVGLAKKRSWLRSQGDPYWRSSYLNIIWGITWRSLFWQPKPGFYNSLWPFWGIVFVGSQNLSTRSSLRYAVNLFSSKKAMIYSEKPLEAIPIDEQCIQEIWYVEII